MNPPNPKAIVAALVTEARRAASTGRSYPYSRGYWQGISQAYLHSARKVAHAFYGLSWANARTRGRLRDARNLY